MNPTPNSRLTDPQQIIAELRRELDECIVERDKAERELDERTAERDETLAQQTATAEILQVINSSPGNLAPVFDAIRDRATRLCEATYGQLAIYDGEFFRFVAKHGTIPFVQQHPTEPLQPSDGVTWQRIVCGEPLVHIPDVADTDLYRGGHAAAQAIVDIGGGRTLLTVALRKDDALLGALTVYRQEVRPFTDKQIALLQNFAAQAVIAMENARLLNELRESLQQQTATADVLKVISRSAFDLQTVLDALLASACRLCEADVGTIRYREGSDYQLASTFGFKPEWINHFLHYSTKPDRGSIFGRTIVDGCTVHIPDVLADPDFKRQIAQKLIGFRAALGVPLVRDGQTFGVISLLRFAAGSFGEKQIELVETFADQAVIAIENVRLFNEVQQRTHDLSESLQQQTATSDVLKIISRSSVDLETVLDTLAETVARLCRADQALIYRRQDDEYHMVAMRGLSGAAMEFIFAHPLAPDRITAVGRAVLEHRAVHIPDVLQDPEHRYRGAQLAGARTLLGIPLLREDALIGVFVVTRTRVEPFTDKEIELATSFADQAVIAMENARLLGELRQRTEEVAELNRGLEARVAEQVEELGRVGRLKRFLAPQLAELIVSQGDEKILESHRREIVVVFCDLRGYTAFTETAEPEEVLDFLREYHGALGPLVSQFEGTLDQFSGDGIMVFFNDPMPIPDPAERAVKMAAAMREAAGALITAWRERGRELGFGVGIAQGYATLGQIGFSERSGYTAIGTVCNVAARLCGEAKDGQILLSQRVNVALKGSVATEPVGALALKGFTQPVVAYNVPLAPTQPALRIIEGGPQSV